MIVSSIVEVERNSPCEDIYFSTGRSGKLEEGHRKTAPIERVFEIITELEGESFSFIAEARRAKESMPHIDWSDGLSDLMSNYGLAPTAWDTLGQAIFAVYMGMRPAFPIQLR